jgi:hypothetical protein
MAKKVILSREAKKFRTEQPSASPPPPPSPAKKGAVAKVAEKAKEAAAKAKEAAEKAAEKVAEAAAKVAEVVQEKVVQPVVEAVAEPPKPKRARFVREKKAPRQPVKLPPLPPPSKKLTAKLMSKNLALPPKEDRPAGPMR